MIVGTEKEYYVEQIDIHFYIRRNDLCEGIYVKYTPDDFQALASIQYEPYRSERIELYINRSENRLDDRTLLSIGLSIVLSYNAGKHDGTTAAIEQVRKSLGMPS